MRFILLLISISSLAHASDTIKPVSFSYNCALAGNIPLLVTYKTQLGGYICGNSVLNTPEKAQKYYWSDSSKTLTAVAFLFGQKQQAPFPGLIKAKVYGVDAATGAPSSLLAESQTASVGNIDTSDNLTLVTFSSPILLPDTFFVALDLSLLNPGDSIGLLSTSDSCYSGEQLAWEKDSAGTWVPFNDGTIITSWGLNIDMAIFPVGDFGLHTGIENVIDGHYSIYPNPAAEKLFIDAGKENTFSLRLFDLQGKVIYETLATGGKHEIDVTGIDPGAYILHISDENRTGTKKVAIGR